MSAPLSWSPADPSIKRASIGTAGSRHWALTGLSPLLQTHAAHGSRSLRGVRSRGTPSTAGNHPHWCPPA
eukprot:scaffold132983_cov39-Prasinocladus_malaysianus.AAC.1